MSVHETTVGSGESRYLAGLAAFESGRYHEAIEDFLVCLEANEDPRIQRLSKNYLGETYARLGAQALRDACYREALDHYAMAISQAPTYPDYHLGRARSHAGLGNADEQVRALKKALELHPGYVDALLAMAAYEYGLNPQEGLARFEKACAFSEDLYGEPYQALLAAHKAGQTGLVIERLLSLRSPGASQANACAASAAEHVLAERVTEAEAGYLKALELAPQYADIRCKYGQFLLSHGRVPEAIVQLRTAVEINSRYVEGLTFLGVALVRNGQDSEGADYLFRALEIDPLHPVATREAAQVSMRRSSK